MFACNSKLPQNTILFRKGQIIIDYKGEQLNTSQLTRRYGNFTAPYAFQVKHNTIIDAACNRGVGSTANTSRGTAFKPNAKLYSHNGNGYIKATSNIRNGDEIFVPYGASYKLNDGSVYSTKYSKN